MAKIALFGRGLNFMGQLGINNKYENLKHFERVVTFDNKAILQIECHLANSVILLADYQIVFFGYIFDSLTTNRVLSGYKYFPKTCQAWQRYSFFGDTLGMRLGKWAPNLINKTMVHKYKVKKFALGGSFALSLTDKNQVFGFGENYKGQLGDSSSRYLHDFDPILSNNEKIKDIAAEDGFFFGSGRNHYCQILRDENFHQGKKREYDCVRFWMKYIIPNEKVIQLKAGFHNSFFLTNKNNLYCHGLNNHGQCGKTNLNKEDHVVNYFHKVYVDLEKDERIIEIAAGKSHNICFTNKNRVFLFGANLHKQFGRKLDLDLDLCSPVQVPLNLQNNEKIVKIKAGFDRSCVITDKGTCYIWGGEELENIGGENYKGIVCLNNELGMDCKVLDVGLGYMHTLAYVEL